MQSPPDGAPWAPAQTLKTNGMSVMAFLVSVSGYVCLLGVGGVLGVVLGLIARHEISNSEGRETGTGLATAAIVLGGINAALTVVGLVMGMTYLINLKPGASGPSARYAPPVTAAPAPKAPKGTPRTAKAPPARASRELGSRVTNLGALSIADISGDFESELEKQRSAAELAGETLVLWVVVPGCKPCDGVAAALSQPVAQKALAKVRFVRADREEFQVELEQLGIPTEKIPGFVLLDSRNHPRDFIHGGEWDADIAANIAPVLEKFVHGSYPKRRHPWHGVARDDETAL